MSEKFALDEKYAKEIILTDPNGPDTITFNADDFIVEKTSATIIYKQPLFIQQFNKLVFVIDGQEYRFERK